MRDKRNCFERGLNEIFSKNKLGWEVNFKFSIREELHTQLMPSCVEKWDENTTE
jgi:hypothetical protein